MTDELSTVEAVLLTGNLASLNPDQRLSYYKQVCSSIGLNPFTRPFDYITLKGKLTLYAKKDATDQLRRLHNVSIGKPEISFQDDLIVVSVTGSLPDGRTDSEIGAVNRKDMEGNVSNALMKAVTKAKRRLTLSICGLGWLDETEVETIPDARTVDDPKALPEPPAPQPAEKKTEPPTLTTPPVTRPGTAEQVRIGARKAAGWTHPKGGEWQRVPDGQQQPPLDRTRERVGSVVSQAIHDPQDKPADTELKRHSVYNHLFGRKSTTELCEQELQAIITIWGNKREGHPFGCNEYAQAEAHVVLAAAMVEAGQTFSEKALAPEPGYPDADQLDA